MASLGFASPGAGDQHVTPMMDLFLRMGRATPRVVGMTMHHRPTTAGFLAITFDILEVFQHGLFHCILHELTHRMLNNMMVLFLKTVILTILTSSVTSSCVHHLVRPVSP